MRKKKRMKMQTKTIIIYIMMDLLKI